MGKITQLTAFVFVVTIGSLMMVSVSSGRIHTINWSLPTRSTFYDDWAKFRKFSVGDKIVFQYQPGLNNLVQVPKRDFDRCTIKNVVLTYFRGRDTITLKRPGHYYFFNSVGKHCDLGQKLHVYVQ